MRLRIRAGREPSAELRTIAAISSAVAANLPDADLFYTGGGGNSLLYILHHRGYTHTVFGVLAGAIGLWGLVLLWRRLRGREALVPPDSRWLFALLLAGNALHLLLDWTNSYGVHALWPMVRGWQYGDAVFIIEPWLWVVSIPAIVAASRRRGVQVLLSLALIGGLALTWRVDLVARPVAVALTLAAVASAVIAGVLSADRRAGYAIASWVMVTVAMMVGSMRAKSAVRAAMRAVAPSADLLDVVASPLPGNPVCISIITVERASGTYTISRARASALPAIVPAALCIPRGGDEGFIASRRPASRDVYWDVHWSAPVSELASLLQDSCVARAAMRFIRVPIWTIDGVSTATVGDARFGGRPGGGFADVRFARDSSACPTGVPSWIPPRADLIGGAVLSASLRMKGRT